jgi:NAD(P)-dependent dehydrogenase (short-subunit alcohol dehydrogenase family)
MVPVYLTTHEDPIGAESQTSPRASDTTLSHDKAFEGKVALIIGGTRGIGRAVANALGTRGCRIVVASRAVAPSTEGPKSDSDQISCDVRSQKEVDAAFQHLIQRYGRVDIVVNCAGIGRSAGSRNRIEPTMTLNDEEWQEVCDTNLRGMFLVARAAAKVMIPQRSGEILNLSSARGAIRGLPFASAYCATKMATRAMFQSLAAELAPFGIRAWSLLPDAVNTGLIADTNLAKRGAIDVAQMGSFIADLLSLTADTLLDDLLLAPFVPTIAQPEGIL